VAPLLDRLEEMWPLRHLKKRYHPDNIFRDHFSFVTSRPTS